MGKLYIEMDDTENKVQKPVITEEIGFCWFKWQKNVEMNLKKEQTHTKSSRGGENVIEELNSTEPSILKGVTKNC